MDILWLGKFSVFISYNLSHFSQLFPKCNRPSPVYIGNITMSNSSFYAYIIKDCLSLCCYHESVCIRLLQIVQIIKDDDAFVYYHWFFQLFPVVFSMECPIYNLGATAFIFALIGFIGSIVFYNAFPAGDHHGRPLWFLSARGFFDGVYRNVILLLVNLALITYPDIFGLSSLRTSSQSKFCHGNLVDRLCHHTITLSAR